MILVIGYGNELRCDDGAGPRVADAVSAWALNGVETMTRQQLTPELADPVSKAGAVIFVDAAASGAEVATTSLEPSIRTEFLGHTSEPGAILALAKSVYGRCPPAWCVTIPGENFEVGDQLSPQAGRGIGVAMERIRGLCQSMFDGMTHA